MVKKSEGRKEELKEELKEESAEKKDISKTWADTAFSKMWEDSYLKLYKPWIESTGDMFEKMALLSKEATPQKYMGSKHTRIPLVNFIRPQHLNQIKRHLKNYY
jgi:alpha-galactosidase/6-phospho-beta-glucosidase family protein